MAKNQPARRNGIRYLVGSSLNDEEATRPAQEPPIPLHQLQPSHADIVRAEDALKPRVVIRNSKKKPAPKKPRRPLVARQRYGLVRTEVAALLNKPGMDKALPPTHRQQYKALAARNLTMDDLATKYRLDTPSMELIVEGWESDIVAKACELYPKFKPRGKFASADTLCIDPDATDEDAQDSEIENSGGKSIGGRVVSRGFNPKKGQYKRLDSFERRGRVHGGAPHPSETADDTGSSGSDGLQDNYGEDSGDDLVRSD